MIGPMSDQDFEPRAAARLIEERRVRQHLSVRAVAPLAAISEGRWRQIAKGYQQAAAGIRVPANPPDATLARMARVVSLDADELEAIGEAGVAEKVRELDIGQARVPKDASPLFGGSFSDPGYLANLEAWLLDLQTRVEELEAARDTDLPRSNGSVAPTVSSNEDGGSSRGSRVAELRESGRALGVVCRVDRPVSRPGGTVLTSVGHDRGTGQRVTLTDSERVAAPSYDGRPAGEEVHPGDGDQELERVARDAVSGTSVSDAAMSYDDVDEPAGS